ncbi:unnamed protein product [Rotaria sp. Silwood1]|nr:unnamed protein product [Rotaria sp. Silwood1]
MAINHKNSRLLPEPQPLDIFQNSSESKKPQHHLNMLALHQFQPVKPYEIGAIHCLTLISHISSLIHHSDKTTTFSIHTTRATDDKTVTTIEIEFIQIEEPKSIVLVFEILHLPHPNTPLFMEIQKLLSTIFHQSKILFTWSNRNRKDLDEFINFQLLPVKIFDVVNIIELQLPFKQWYNQTFKHDKNCSVPSFCNMDAVCCICPYRPYKCINDQWSLEKAVNYVFNEYIRESNQNDTNYPDDINQSIFDYQSNKFLVAKPMTNRDRNIERDIDRFDDIFHHYGDDIDEDKDTTVDFDHLYTIFGKDNDMDETDVVETELFNDNKNISVDLTVEEEEEHLSQKLSQLSAVDKEQDLNNKFKSSTVNKRPTLTPSTTIENISKKMKFDKEEQISHLIPRYLSSNTKTFEQMINPILQKTRISISIEYLREIALLIHQIECVNLDQLLWTTYLRSGTGTLKPQTNTTLYLWPVEVKQRMMDRGQTTASNPNEIGHASCLDYVQRVLQKFQNQTDHYQAQLKERKQRLLNCWTCEIEEAITKFVRQYVEALYKITTEGLIAAVEYDYHDRLIQLEYEQENPNEHQKQIFADLTQAKYDKETAKLDLAIMKQRIVYNHLPKSFESLRIPAPISLETVTDRTIRQNLLDRCEKILQRAKSDMMMVYTTTAEAKLDQLDKKFDSEMTRMKQNQRSRVSHQILTETMLEILERRFKYINEHLMRLYKLKLRFFVRAPTVKN